MSQLFYPLVRKFPPLMEVRARNQTSEVSDQWLKVSPESIAVLRWNRKISRAGIRKSGNDTTSNKRSTSLSRLRRSVINHTQWRG
jgi:hypothetical protein